MSIFCKGCLRRRCKTKHEKLTCIIVAEPFIRMSRTFPPPSLSSSEHGVLKDREDPRTPRGFSDSRGSWDRMTGRPGNHTMEMNGGSAASYTCPRAFPYLAKGFLDFQGRRGITSIVPWNFRLVIFGLECHVGTLEIQELKRSSSEERCSQPSTWSIDVPKPRILSCFLIMRD